MGETVEPVADGPDHGGRDVLVQRGEERVQQVLHERHGVVIQLWGTVGQSTEHEEKGLELRVREERLEVARVQRQAEDRVLRLARILQSTDGSTGYNALRVVRLVLERLHELAVLLLHLLLGFLLGRTQHDETLKRRVLVLAALVLRMNRRQNRGRGTASRQNSLRSLSAYRTRG